MMASSREGSSGAEAMLEDTFSMILGKETKLRKRRKNVLPNTGENEFQLYSWRARKKAKQSRQSKPLRELQQVYGWHTVLGVSRKSRPDRLCFPPPREGVSRERCREKIDLRWKIATYFSECPFTMEEALRTFKPSDPVGYAASFLDGNARKSLISAWSRDGKCRPNSWREFWNWLEEVFGECNADESYRVRWVRLKQSGDLEAYITEFTGLCLEVPELGELTKITLFLEGLSSLVVKKEVRRDHPKTLAAAIRAARLAEIEEKKTRGITEHDVTFIRSDRSDTSRRWSYLKDIL